jgi:hypothetical protein
VSVSRDATGTGGLVDLDGDAPEIANRQHPECAGALT